MPLAEEYINHLYWGHPTKRYWVDPLILVGGSIIDAADGAHLERDLGIKAVVSMESEHSDEGKVSVPICALPTADNGQFKPPALFRLGLAFAEPFLRRKQPVYVHCQMGGSRSPSMAYALLRGCLGLSKTDALARIKVDRPEYGSHPFHLNYISSVDDALF